MYFVILFAHPNDGGDWVIHNSERMRELEEAPLTPIGSTLTQDFLKAGGILALAIAAVTFFASRGYDPALVPGAAPKLTPAVGVFTPYLQSTHVQPEAVELVVEPAAVAAEPVTVAVESVAIAVPVLAAADPLPEAVAISALSTEAVSAALLPSAQPQIPAPVLSVEAVAVQTAQRPGVEQYAVMPLLEAAEEPGIPKMQRVGMRGPVSPYLPPVIMSVSEAMLLRDRMSVRAPRDPRAASLD